VAKIKQIAEISQQHKVVAATMTKKMMMTKMATQLTKEYTNHNLLAKMLYVYQVLEHLILVTI